MGKVKAIGKNKKVKVVKKLASGMYETADGDRVPPYTGVKIGDILEIVGGKFEFPDKKVQTMEPENPLQKENDDLKARMEKLEAIVGAKGSEVKVGADAQK